MLFAIPHIIPKSGFSRIRTASVVFFVALILSSCAADEPQPMNSSGQVVFSISLPAKIVTRFSDAKGVTNLAYSVFYASDAKNDGPASAIEFGSLSWDGLSDAVVSLDVLPNQEYAIVFFAYNEEAMGDSKAYCYDASSAILSIDYDLVVPNNDAYDAFFGVSIFDSNGGGKVELSRPFAQLNVGTDDMAWPIVSSYLGLNPENDFTGRLTVEGESGLARSVDFLRNVYEEQQQSVTFTTRNLCKAPVEGEFPVKGYGYLNMNYLLMMPESNGGPGSTLVNASYTTSLSSGAIVNDISLAALPLRKNYSTNVYGSLLTARQEVEVSMESSFGGEVSLTSQKVKEIEMTAADFRDALQRGLFTVPSGTMVTVPMNDSDFSMIGSMGQNPEMKIDGILRLVAETDASGSYNYFFNVGKPMTITGSGKIVAEGYHSIFSVNGTTLTIKGVTIEYDPYVNHTGTSKGDRFGSAICLGNLGKVNLEAVTIKSPYCGVSVEGLGASSLTMKDVNIIQTDFGDNLAFPAINIDYSLASTPKSAFQTIMENVCVDTGGTCLYLKGDVSASLSDCSFSTTASVTTSGIILSETGNSKTPMITINSGSYAKSGSGGIIVPVAQGLTLKGGRYSSQPTTVTGATIYPAPGYKWQELTGALPYRWEVISD